MVTPGELMRAYRIGRTHPEGARMPSRQDQLHSYQFTVQRVVAALVMRETDPPHPPLRRAAGTALVGVLIAAIGLGAAAVYGVLAGGGGTKWRDAGAVIVEKESGARYVYRDDKLHLVLNYASARLIIGAADPKTVLVSRKSIEGVPRGTPLGIADAPDSLPDAGRLTSAPWTVCSLPPGDAAPPRSALLVGVPAVGGQLVYDDGVLARHPDGGLHLIWHNRRYRISGQREVLSALGWISKRPVPVAPALLNALTAGADLGPVPVPGQGRPSAKVPNAKVGEVFVVASQGGDRQYFVALRDGLAGITQLQANVLMVAVHQYDPVQLPPARFADIPRQPDLIPDGPEAPPANIPQLAAADPGALCGQVSDDSGVREVRVGSKVPDLGGTAATGARSGQGAALADHVLVQPGRGAVVEAAAAAGAPGGALCVVTDLGRRYAVTGGEVLSMLGYAKVTPLRLPANLVALVPAGKVLDPEAARAPATRE
jgi:type VII secretion protein EccB